MTMLRDVLDSVRRVRKRLLTCRLLALLPVGLVVFTSAPAQTFNDAPPGHWAFSHIETLAANSVSGGCGSDNFCPDDPVTRAQMAVFLERGINGGDFTPPAATGNVFLDVGATDFAASFIEQLFLDGITSGCGNNRFCPADPVTRAQMAVFLLRAKHGADYIPPPPSEAFADVDLSHWASAWVEQLFREGITGGCGGGNFCPEDPVSRAQMAVFLVRTFDLVHSTQTAALYPTSWRMPFGETVKFTTNLAGSVEWFVNGVEGGNDQVGTISRGGLYLAPASIPSGNPVVVRATLAANPAESVEAEVYVTPPSLTQGLLWYRWTPRVAERGSDRVMVLDTAFSGYPEFLFERRDGLFIEPVPIQPFRYRFYIPTSIALVDHDTGDLKNFAGTLHCDTCSRPLLAAGQVEVPVLDASIPAATVYPLDETAQAASHFLNVRQDGASTGFSWPATARKFYQYFPDEFDFIVLVRAVNLNLSGGGTGIASGGHRRNDILGIGVEVYDYLFDYGSAGRLHGAVQFGSSVLFDYAGTLFLHELNHTWAAYLRLPPINADSHWPQHSSLTRGMVGTQFIRQFTPLGGDLFEIVCPSSDRVQEYSDVELYLMGLIGPGDVSPQYVARDPGMFACTRVVEADVVTIDDLIAQYGERSPDYTVSRKDFAAATVVYSSDRLLTPAEMAWFNHMAQRAEAREPLPTKNLYFGRTTANPFYVATGGRGTLSTRIVPE